jgi:hypothetical protein
MITPAFKASVENGKLVFNNIDFDKYLQKLNGKEVSVIVNKHKKHKDFRSNNQNKYYWGVCVALIAEHTGYTTDEAHEALKYQFLLDRSGKLPIVRSTKDLDTEEMEVYLNYIRQWASAELGVYVPLPNETDVYQY